MDMTLKTQAEKKYLRDWLRRLPPRWLFRLFAWFGFKPAPMKALIDASAFMLPQWMYTAIKLDIPELLLQRPRSARELAEELSLSADRLVRLLYALEQHGYFKRVGRRKTNHDGNQLDGVWEHTALSAVLSEKHPNTIRAIVLHWIEDCYAPSGTLLHAIKADGCAFRLHHEGQFKGFFEDYLSTFPEQSRQFSNAMSATSAFTDEAVLRDFPWSRYEHVIDVGGSNGSFLELLLERCPKMKGTIFDLEEVIVGARTVWSEKPSQLASRVTLEAGSFFDVNTIPKLPESSAFVLRNILHDWSDDECLSILSNLRQAMPSEKSTLVLIELGLGFDANGHVLEQARSTIDMLMMTMFDGRERTRTHFENLFKQTGFELKSITSTRSVAHVIEATPI